MYFGVLKFEERFVLHFWWLNDREKGMTNDFNSYKLKRKMGVVYLEAKVQ